MTGRNHSGIILSLVAEGYRQPVLQRMQGFIDEEGVFLSRREAYDRAVECGQIEDDGGTRILLSEMLAEGGGR